MGFLLPTAHEGRRSTNRGLCRYVPSSGFGYPLDGLLPSVPCRFYFTPAALMGFALRSFLLSKGHRTLPPGWTHLPFLLPVLPARKAMSRPGQAAVPGFSPFRESLTASEGFSLSAVGCSLGFSAPSSIPIVRADTGRDMRSPCIVPCITADYPMRFGQASALP
jgi:hypothetical protein